VKVSCLVRRFGTEGGRSPTKVPNNRWHVWRTPSGFDQRSARFSSRRPLTREMSCAEAGVWLIAIIVRRKGTLSSLWSPAKKLTGVLLVFLVLFLSGLATDLGHHKAIHTDAGSADHQCAITLFAHGQVLHSVAAPLLQFAPQEIWVSLPLPERAPFPSHRHLLPPSCGPPALFS
jgi:hypothetical protein